MTREEWLKELRARREKHPGGYMCFCSVHCVMSSYHESACCTEPWCHCLCHLKKEEASEVPNVR